MKIEKITIAITSAVVLAACSIANANTETSKDHNMYVYQDCQQVQTIAMTAEQVEAYKALKAHEVKMEKLELPLEKMEQELEVHERELELLSEDFVYEDGDKIVVNKALVKQHEAIARKIEQVVASHQQDIDELEREARVIERLADKFEQVIEPSLAQYDGQNVQIQIGQNNTNWHCQA